MKTKNVHRIIFWAGRVIEPQARFLKNSLTFRNLSLVIPINWILIKK